jgi:hypothetical protein
MMKSAYWRAVLMRKGAEAIALVDRRGMTPPELMGSPTKQHQWRVELMNELIRKVTRSIKAAQSLDALGNAPNAALMTRVADTCHFVGWKEGYWNSQGIRNREEVATALRTVALTGFELALQIDSSEKGALYGKGEISFIEECFDEASVCFKKLLEIGVDDDTAKSIVFYLSVCNGSRQLSSVLAHLKKSDTGSLDHRLFTKLLTFWGIQGR